MSDDTDPQISLATQRLRAYLHIHAGAADTFEGIAQWWLGNETVSVRALQAALDRLVDEGLLVTRQLPSGETLWCAHGPAAPAATDEPRD